MALKTSYKLGKNAFPKQLLSRGFDTYLIPSLRYFIFSQKKVLRHLDVLGRSRWEVMRKVWQEICEGKLSFGHSGFSSRSKHHDSSRILAKRLRGYHDPHFLTNPDAIQMNRRFTRETMHSTSIAKYE